MREPILLFICGIEVGGGWDGDLFMEQLAAP